MRKLLLAVLLTAIVAAPASAAVQNIKVGGDLKSFHVLRSDFNLGTTIQNEQNVLASIAKVNVAADLSDNVSVVLQLINEREWGENSGTEGDTSVDLDLAYIELKEFLYSPLTVTIGRQNLAYGNALIIGGPNDSDTNGLNNTAFLGEKYGWDAIKLQLDYDPLTIDIFAAKDDQGGTNTITGLDGNDDDNDVYGINLAYELGDDMETVVESYFFAKVDNSGETAVSDGEATNVYVPGIRVSTNPIEGLSFGAEFAWQYGDIGGVGASSTNNLEAYALQLTSSYALPILTDYSPVLTLGYTHLSGDGDSSDSEVNAWDPMFEDQHLTRIFGQIFNYSNLNLVEVGLEMTPLEDLTVAGTWYGLWLDEEYATAGLKTLALQDYAMTTDSELGHEFALDVTYAYTEDVTFGVTAGIFAPGDAFDKDNQQTASQVVSSVAVAF